ncbi:hypothetical protein DFH08DRAFT_817619 [Mycena albidolilacea]|uniref:Uncharacterized protein n=1 Tax=Mycena albidolilacea TaxID=1033008 RepID=A0AAD7EIE9_9AGAR|nr:hypothetical protein DFH08DRAFT_817619 [Mycena albidolilacea]
MQPERHVETHPKLEKPPVVAPVLVAPAPVDPTGLVELVPLPELIHSNLLIVPIDQGTVLVASTLKNVTLQAKLRLLLKRKHSPEGDDAAPPSTKQWREPSDRTQSKDEEDDDPDANMSSPESNDNGSGNNNNNSNGDGEVNSGDEDEDEEMLPPANQLNKSGQTVLADHQFTCIAVMGLIEDPEIFGKTPGAHSNILSRKNLSIQPIYWRIEVEAKHEKELDGPANNMALMKKNALWIVKGHRCKAPTGHLETYCKWPVELE